MDFFVNSVPLLAAELLVNCVPRLASSAGFPAPLRRAPAALATAALASTPSIGNGSLVALLCTAGTALPAADLSPAEESSASTEPGLMLVLSCIPVLTFALSFGFLSA